MSSVNCKNSPYLDQTEIIQDLLKLKEVHCPDLDIGAINAQQNREIADFVREKLQEIGCPVSPKGNIYLGCHYKIKTLLCAYFSAFTPNFDENSASIFPKIVDWSLTIPAFKVPLPLKHGALDFPSLTIKLTKPAAQVRGIITGEPHVVRTLEYTCQNDIISTETKTRDRLVVVADIAASATNAENTSSVTEGFDIGANVVMDKDIFELQLELLTFDAAILPINPDGSIGNPEESVNIEKGSAVNQIYIDKEFEIEIPFTLMRHEEA
jgi:hypothetical protein